MAINALDGLHDALNGDGSFWKMVAGACWLAARDIESEDAATQNHANRLVWAARVKANRKAVAREMLGDVLENATLAAALETSAVNDIQFVVNSLIDTFATGE